MGAGQRQQRVELGSPITAGPHRLEHGLEIGGRRRSVEQVDVQPGALAQDRVVSFARRRKPSAAARSASASSIRGIARWARARMASSSARRAPSLCSVSSNAASTWRTASSGATAATALRAGELEVMDRAFAGCRRAGELQVVRDVGRVLVGRPSEPLLHRVGDAQVQPLAPRRRQVGEQRLADLFVHEAVHDFAAAVLPFHQARVLGFFERVEQRVLVEPGDNEEELEARAPRPPPLPS